MNINLEHVTVTESHSVARPRTESRYAIAVRTDGDAREPDIYH